MTRIVRLDSRVLRRDRGGGTDTRSVAPSRDGRRPAPFALAPSGRPGPVATGVARAVRSSAQGSRYQATGPVAWDGPVGWGRVHVTTVGPDGATSSRYRWVPDAGTSSDRGLAYDPHGTAPRAVAARARACAVAESARVARATRQARAVANAEHAERAYRAWRDAQRAKVRRAVRVAVVPSLADAERDDAASVARAHREARQERRGTARRVRVPADC